MHPTEEFVYNVALCVALAGRFLSFVEIHIEHAKVQKRVDELKRAWHDERREKEKASREQEEALAYAKKILAEKKKV